MNRLLSCIVVVICHMSNPHVAGASCEAPNKGDEITVALSHLPRTIDPTAGWHYQHFLLVQNAFQSLVRVNEQGQVMSAIASRWSPMNGGQRYVFSIDPRARFHDGRHVTSHDVAYSIARHLWPDSKSVMRRRLVDILVGAENLAQNELPRGITILSENMVAFDLRGPYPPFLRLMAMPTFAIVSERSFVDPTRPVGSGPMVAQYDPVATSWTFRKSGSYELSNVTVDSLVVRQFDDSNAAIHAAKDGRLDLLIGVNRETMQSPLPENVIITPLQALATMHFFFNNSRPLFHERSLRHSLAQALRGAARQVAGADRLLTYSPFFMPRGILPNSYYQEPPPQTVAEQASARLGSSVDTSRRLQLVLRSEYFDRRAADAIAAALQSFGFESQVRLVPARDITKILQERDYDIVSGGYMASFPDPDAFIDSVTGGPGTYSYGEIPAGELDLAIRRVRLNGDAQQRLRDYAAILRVFEENDYFVPAFRLNVVYLHDRRLQIPASHYRYEPELWKMYCVSGERGT